MIARMRPAGALVVVVAASLSACGGKHHDGNVRANGRTTSTIANGATTTVNPLFLPGGKSSSTTRSSSNASTPSTTASGGSTTLPTGAQGVPRAPLETHMAHACVRRGDTQTITVKSTPNFQYSIATQWPDGGGHLDYNAWALGRVPANGVVTKSWTIPQAATMGDARTDVEVTNDNGSQISFDHPTWRIAAKC